MNPTTDDFRTATNRLAETLASTITETYGSSELYRLATTAYRAATEVVIAAHSVPVPKRTGMLADNLFAAVHSLHDALEAYEANGEPYDVDTAELRALTVDVDDFVAAFA